MPPLVNIPATVSNLSAVQRGDKLIVQFTLPTKTTEGQPLNPPVVVDLRLGGEHPKPTTMQNGTALYEIPGTDWIGKTAVIEVRAMGSNGKESGWASVSLPVVAPPPVPRDIRAEQVGTAVRLTWQSTGTHFRVLRAGEGKDAGYAMVAPDLQQREWTDTAVEFGKTYRYLVQGFEPAGANRVAESDLPEPVSFKAVAPLPVAPTGLRAVAGLGSIELSWEAPEGGTPAASFRIYRATGDGEFVKIGESEGLPSYSDKTAEAGKTYRYAISAVDADGREGPKSAAIEAAR